MLKRINPNENGASVYIKEAKFPSPFVSGLEFSAPARGAWNIVHTGMLIPQTHQIFVCAANCLRGVVLTAAEMNALDRFSTIEIKENNLYDGDMETLIIDGVSNILEGLDYKPKAILLYTSCIHHFMGCDMPMVFRTLREKFSDIDFTDCYMNPIMRKSGLSPDQLMRRQMYSLLKTTTTNDKVVNIIGNNLATDNSTELRKILNSNGYKIQEITDFSTYEDYQRMAQAKYNIVYNPVSVCAGEMLEKVHNQKYFYLPVSYSFDEIESNYKTLCESLYIELPDFNQDKLNAKASLDNAKEIIGSTPIAIDYTATTRPLSLARMLLENSFNVTTIYADSFCNDEKLDFEWLKENAPNLKIYATVHAKMRVLKQNSDKKILAIGQKATFFTGTDYFINIVENGGHYGFDGIVQLTNQMIVAYSTAKKAKDLIQVKGLGCECCI